MTISIVHDFTTWTKAALVPPIDEYLHFTPSGERYRPILFINDYWNLNKDYVPLNETVGTSGQLFSVLVVLVDQFSCDLQMKVYLAVLRWCVLCLNMLF